MQPRRAPKDPEPPKTTGEIPFEERAKVETANKPARLLQAEHEKEVEKSEQLWKQRAEWKEWDSAVADMSVSKFNCQRIDSDARRTEEYKELKW